MLPQDDYAGVRRVLLADAATCAVAGALMAFAATPVAQLTNLPEPLLRIAGFSLFPVTALFGWMATSRTFSRALLRLAVLGNAAWVVGSLAVLALTAPNGPGYVFVLAQAAAVAMLALLEARALKASLGLSA